MFLEDRVPNFFEENALHTCTHTTQKKFAYKQRTLHIKAPGSGGIEVSKNTTTTYANTFYIIHEDGQKYIDILQNYPLYLTDPLDSYHSIKHIIKRVFKLSGNFVDWFTVAPQKEISMGIDIKKNVIGKRVHPGSVSVRVTFQDSLERLFVDEYSQELSELNNVTIGFIKEESTQLNSGIIFYDIGLILLYKYNFVGTIVGDYYVPEDVFISFKSTKEYTQHNVQCPIVPANYGRTHNPTTVIGTETLDKDIEVQIRKVRTKYYIKFTNTSNLLLEEIKRGTKVFFKNSRTSITASNFSVPTSTTKRAFFGTIQNTVLVNNENFSEVSFQEEVLPNVIQNETMFLEAKVTRNILNSNITHLFYTTVGLYNRDKKLVGVTKLQHPIPIVPNIDQNVLITFDQQ